MDTSGQFRRWFFCVSMVLLTAPLLLLQAQEAELIITNQDHLCAGFTENSTATVEIVTDTPFRLPKSAGLVFDWYADHEQALKRWNTPLPFRSVPLPWPGEYNIWVVVKYVHKQTLVPFDSFKTKVITIKVEACP